MVAAMLHLRLRPPSGVGLPPERAWCRMQGASGGSKSLKALAKQLLGLDIQRQGARHDAEEDARAVMLLYVQVAELGAITDYGDLVAYYTRQALARAEAGGAAAEDRRDENEGD
jgi:DNA polymerase III epsilon subunit-like protein